MYKKNIKKGSLDNYACIKLIYLICIETLKVDIAGNINTITNTQKTFRV